MSSWNTPSCNIQVDCAEGKLPPSLQMQTYFQLLLVSAESNIFFFSGDMEIWLHLQASFALSSPMTTYYSVLLLKGVGKGGGGVLGLWILFCKPFLSKQPTSGVEVYRSTWQSGEYPHFDTVWPLFEKSWLCPCCCCRWLLLLHVLLLLLLLLQLSDEPLVNYHFTTQILDQKKCI